MTTTVQGIPGTRRDRDESRPPIWGGSEESWADYVTSCHAGFKPPLEKRTKWDEVGDVDGTFCRNCGSHFCPHAAPSIYSSPA